ncbi:hypothetical protein NQ314_014210 [Rhamnusium bicolor]|uniref:Uncharacterized protein n=1 Tax=Rhamnusium bicolor TaxID=1586634 RepID=A0AAV8X2I2_9CUCU|nr:hypothetical protein NQ314_014210 [Rhamnusium bicolor]
MPFQKGSNERKKLIDLLRTPGNFSVYSDHIVQPVQRPTSSSTKITLSDDFLPCKYCKDLYKKETRLASTLKKCFFNNGNDSAIRYSSEGQTLLAFQESRKPFLDRLRLKTEVFNKMHADRISLNGKTDVIVCQYA